MALLADSGQALTDGSTWQTALLERLSVAMSSALNEFGICVQVVFQPSKATASYEKAALMIQAQQQDESDFQNGVIKFGVAADFRNMIGGGIQSGQVHGLYVEAGTLAGSDGEVQVVEFGCNNNSDPKPYGTPGAKSVVNIFAGEYAGNRNATCAIGIAPGTAKFQDGAIIIETAALAPGTPALRIIDNTTGKDTVRILGDGTVQYTKLEPIS